MLGVCLGAQQLAAALGAEVTTGPSAEVGLGQVELTPTVVGTRYSAPSTADWPAPPCPVCTGTSDTFSLPAGAVHLAATRAFPHQAFRAGPDATDSSSTSRWTGRWPRVGPLLPPACASTAPGWPGWRRWVAGCSDASSSAPWRRRRVPTPFFQDGMSRLDSARKLSDRRYKITALHRSRRGRSLQRCSECRNILAPQTDNCGHPLAVHKRSRPKPGGFRHLIQRCPLQCIKNGNGMVQ